MVDAMAKFAVFPASFFELVTINERRRLGRPGRRSFGSVCDVPLYVRTKMGRKWDQR